MTHKSHHGFGGPKTDNERAKLRGKGREPDYPSGSDEGRRTEGQQGGGGGPLGLRGYPVDEKLDSVERQREQRKQ